MKKIHSFGIIAFKQTRQICTVLENINIWSSKSGVPVLFHPLLKKQLSEKAPIAKKKKVPTATLR